MPKLVALTPPAHTPSTLPDSSHHPSKHKTFAKAHELERSLREVIKGEVRFGEGDRALYATDGSNYRQVPIGVVVPRDLEDAIAVMRLCRMHGAPLLSRGVGPACVGNAATSQWSWTFLGIVTRSLSSIMVANLRACSPASYWIRSSRG